MSSSIEPPYSRLREVGDLVLTAGILGRADAGLVAGGSGPELRQALTNLDALLATAGRTSADVVRLVVYLADIADIDVLDEAFVEHFAEPRPARTTVAVVALPGGASVEIEATAIR